jgi:putative Mn2+ efflux pump MntP
MLKKLSIVLFSFILSRNALACAMCMGTNPKDKYFLYVVGVFIVLIYIPMYYLFKTFMKYRKVNQIPSESDI